MRRLAASLVLCLTLSLGAEEELKSQTPLQAIAQGNSAFGLKLYGQIIQGDDNICISPINISAALVIPYLGAVGDTKSEMQTVLNYTLESPQLEHTFQGLTHFLTKHPSNYPVSYRVLMADSLWIQDKLRVNSKFMATARKELDADVQRVDFINQTETARTKINRWVSHHTSGKITELLSKGILDTSTRMVVVSALYLKAKWMSPFTIGLTRNDTFIANKVLTKSVPMMQQTAEFPFYDGDTFSMLELELELPAADAPALVVDFVLPKDKHGLPELENQLSPEVLQGWLERLTNTHVAITLPKFTIRQTLNLSKTLQNMGMKAAFQGNADFSGITGTKDLYISDVVHQTYFDCAEGGVEAAAATGAIMNMKSSLETERPKVFRADHPFLFILRERTTGTILFLGRVTNP